MAGIIDMMDRIRSIDVSNVSGLAIEAAKDTYAEQQRNQMFDGKNSVGGRITPPYSTSYAKWKRRRYPSLPRHVSLHLTGYFKSRISLDVKGNTITYFSDDVKDPWLTNMYGEVIWGLYGKYRKPFIARVKSEFNYLMKSELGI